jgi:hypothetical protein
MNTGRSWRPLAALALGAAALSGALAAHAVYNPPIRMANGIEYMGGGGSSEEAALMQSVEPRWPASFEFAVKDGTRQVSAADVVVTVRDASGRELLSQVEAGGPFLAAEADRVRLARRRASPAFLKSGSARALFQKMLKAAQGRPWENSRLPAHGTHLECGSCRSHMVCPGAVPSS